MSSELLFTLAGLVLVIVGARILYELKNAPMINDDHENEPEQVYKDGIPIGPKYRPGKGGVLYFPDRPKDHPGQGGIH